MTAGRVTVNGRIARELGTKVDVDRDRIEVDGRRVRLADGPAYLMLNKPAGVLTTMSDPQGRPTVAELVPIDAYPGLFPVGRLDFDTTGLLLFTTDGDLGQALLHPSHHVDKTYIALVDGRVTASDLEPLCRGIMLDDGPCRPARCRILKATQASCVCPNGIPRGTSVVQITIHEGRKNQVKRMLSAVGHPVLALHRPRFGPLRLGDLAPGSWRLLDEREISQLVAPEASRSIQPFQKG